MVKVKLLDQVRYAIRTRHMSIRTEQAYLHWIKRFIFYHDKRHPKELDESQISSFLTNLAVERKVSASTQNQAMSAILFLYRHVLKMEIGWLDGVERAKRTARLPVVFTRREVADILLHLGGVKWIMASLLHGAGLTPKLHKQQAERGVKRKSSKVIRCFQLMALDYPQSGFRLLGENRPVVDPSGKPRIPHLFRC